ncbi:MAG: hypothetical protein V1747_09960 [Candidatus Omnitrophota bacterium]
MFKHFEGQSGVVIEVDPGVAHGLKNTGTKPLIVGVFSNKANDLNNPDNISKIVV